MNQSEAARKFNVGRTNIIYWMQQEKKVTDKEKFKSNKKLYHKGRKPQGQEFEQELRYWILRQRRDMLPVNMDLLVRYHYVVLTIVDYASVVDVSGILGRGQVTNKSLAADVLAKK